MLARAFIIWTHRWLGLVNAVILALAGLTGALIVFPVPYEPRELLIEFHVNLFAGELGRWVVVAASVATLLLQAGGLWLWWPTKSLRIRRTRGWWRFTYDLHNWIGVVTLPMMALLAATGVGRVLFEFITVPDALRLVPRAVGLLHHGGPFPAPIQALYVLGSLAFVVQSATGVLMWWRPLAAGQQQEATKYAAAD